MILQLARALAEELVEAMRPYCERVEIAGSIRRGKADCGDIELVAIPKWESKPDPFSLFTGETYEANLLWEWANTEANIKWIKTGTTEIIPWKIESDGKYWRGLLPQGIKLDLFLAGPGNFGLIYLIRTGSDEFSKAVVTQALRIGKRCKGGYLHTTGGDVIVTPTEDDVFAALNLAYVEPAARTNAGSLRARR